MLFCLLLEKPILFTEDGYRLRCHQNGYKIKIFIVVTMYNEDDKELVRTLRGEIIFTLPRPHTLMSYPLGICENLKHLSEKEGVNVWQKFAVCIVCDGRAKVMVSDVVYFYACTILILPTFLGKSGDAELCSIPRFL
jgi:hypothetical protein